MEGGQGSGADRRVFSLHLSSLVVKTGSSKTETKAKTSSVKTKTETKTGIFKTKTDSVKTKTKTK